MAGEKPDCLVDQVGGHVVAVLEPAGRVDRRIVAHQLGRILVGLGVEKSVKPVEPAAHDTDSNYPLGWAMASNTPLRRYKFNTHGGGVRDPLVISWPRGIAARGELRHQFAHACDLAPTLLEIVGVAPPAEIAGVAQMP